MFKRGNISKILPAIIFLAMFFNSSRAGEEQVGKELSAGDLLVLTGRTGFDNFEDQLSRYLGEIGTAAYHDRKERIEAVANPEDYKEYLQERRESFLAGIGPFPPRTPLNAKTYGQIDCGDYLIEKVVFESRPGYMVTANLFVPKSYSPPWPVVLCPMGHWGGNEGKDYHYVQKRGAGLASLGYLALVFEPFGQGERRIYYDPSLENRTPLGWATNQHAYLNYPLQLTGHNMANFFIWDGIRGIDYLLSRPGADSSRVAVTGASGGGSQTRIIAAVDRRVTAAVPVCANSHLGGGFRPGLGNPDGEQNVPGLSRYGIEFADQLIASSARSLLLLNASGDRNSVVSSVDMYNDISGLFERAGIDREISYRLIGSDHSYNRDFRETLYHWLNRQFGREHLPGVEEEIRLHSEGELNITASGTVAELGSETPLTLNRKFAEEIIPEKMELKTPADLTSFKAKLNKNIRQVLQLEESAGGPRFKARSLAEEQIDGFRIEKVVISPEEGIDLPGILIEPVNSAGRSVTLYLHERGKANGVDVIRGLVEAGKRVFALDVRGWSERPDPHPELNWNSSERKYELIYGKEENDSRYNAYCYQLQRSLFGMRVKDVLSAVAYLRSRPDVDPDSVAACGWGDGAMLLLHAAVLDDRISSLALNRTLISFQALATEKLWSHSPFLFIHNVLAHYDVPELIAAMAGRRLLLAGTVDALRGPVEPEVVHREYAYAKEAFRLAGLQDSFRVAGALADEQFAGMAARLAD